MGVDYYHFLNVPKSAGDEELRRAYKKLVVKWHPDKHPSNSQKSAEAKFKQICEAYDVLSDSHKRQIYDLHGEEGLKYGDYDVSSPSSGPGFDADDVFAEFLGSSKSDNNNNNSNNKKNNAKYYRKKTSNSGKKAAPVESKLGCTLEELYKGSKRKMKISRILSDDSGKPRTVEEVLSIDIKAGWKKGTKITFPEKGNQELGCIPGDLIFVIDEKPHSSFKRDKNDLIIHLKLSLLDALTGKTLNLKTLDGRDLTIKVYDVVKPGREVVVQGEGMPISKEPNKRGDLRIKFDVKFPSTLSVDQKTELKRVLDGSS